ncbi:MAG: ribonuclease HI [Oscillospiraceae bacterium]|nr:ribonuclease HI [Oscillospiraceae bacterium]
MKQVDLYTDGACSGNPGPGGYGAILSYNGRELELSGYEGDTTNNRMELTAVIRGLETLKERCRVTVYSDSKYVIDTIQKGWLDRWIANGWRNSQKKAPPNEDLWRRLRALLDAQEVEFVWIRGHAGHPFNERCDALAVSEYINRREL